MNSANAHREYVELVTGPDLTWTYGVVTDTLPDANGSIGVHCGDGITRRVDPYNLSDAVEADIRATSPKEWTELSDKEV